MPADIKKDNIIALDKEGLSKRPQTPVKQDKSKSEDKKFVGLNRKLLLLILPLLILGIGFIIVATNIQLRNSLRNQLQAERSRTVQGIEDQMAAFFVDKVNQIKVASLSSLMTQALKERNASYQGSPEEIVAGIEALDKVWRNDAETDPANSAFIQGIISNNARVNIVAAELHNFLNNFPEHTEVFITDLYGATLGSTAELSDYYQADEGWWQAAWNNGEGAVFISQPEFDASAGVNALLISLPILDNNEIIGVIRSTLDVDAVFDLVATLSFGEIGHAILINQNGEVMADPFQDANLSSKDLSPELLQHFLEAKQGAITFRDEQGDDSLFNFENLNITEEHHEHAHETEGLEGQIFEAINQLGWVVVARQKISEALGVVGNITLSSAILGLVTIVATLLLIAIFTRRLTSPLRELTEVAQKVAQGNLAVSANVETNDETGVLADTFNDAINNLQTAIEEIERRSQEADDDRMQLQANIMNFLEVMLEVSEGDFTKRGSVTEDALGNVVDATNLMIEEVGFLLQDVKSTARDVGKGANDMISTSALIAQNNESRVSTANRLAEGLKIIANSMQTVSKNVIESAQTAQSTLLASQQGGQAVQNTLKGMERIRQEVDTIAARMNELNVRSKEISEVTDAIHNISSQVSLLALHASLEAAGAGKEGERFSVVAEEVGQLADDSAKLSERVSQLIKGVQGDIAEVNQLVETGKKEVESGYQLAGETGERLGDIGKIAERSAELVHEVEEQIGQQVKRLNSINKGLQNMSATGLQSKDIVDKGRKSAENLRGRSQILLERLGRFRIEEAA